MEAKEHQLRQELKDLQTQLQDPGVFTNQNYPKLAKRASQLESLVHLFDEKNRLVKAKHEAEKLLKSNDEDMVTLAKAELEDLQDQIEQNNDALTAALVPKDPNDERDAIMEIRAAAGGDEASLFAGDLYRMYVRWAETHNFKIELISNNANEVGGFKEVIFALRGDNAYKNFKFEAGVHRVQRVPTTESQGRIHTSTVTVAVLPEAEETDVEINPSDLRIDVYHSSDMVARASIQLIQRYALHICQPVLW